MAEDKKTWSSTYVFILIIMGLDFFLVNFWEACGLVHNFQNIWDFWWYSWFFVDFVAVRWHFGFLLRFGDFLSCSVVWWNELILWWFGDCHVFCCGLVALCVSLRFGEFLWSCGVWWNTLFCGGLVIATYFVAVWYERSGLTQSTPVPADLQLSTALS